jgi:hypothetical protein
VCVCLCVCVCVCVCVCGVPIDKPGVQDLGVLTRVHVHGVQLVELSLLQKPHASLV